MPITDQRADTCDRTKEKKTTRAGARVFFTGVCLCTCVLAIALLDGCSNRSDESSDAVSIDANGHRVFTTNFAQFDWFQYEGTDPVNAQTPLAPDQYRNPILAGFYPDPSICRVGDDYYLVNSTFTYFPGVPIFHSRDLVNWTQIGHVLTRPSQLELGRVPMLFGIFAPTIRYHDDTFYVITTLFGGMENFFVTATDPAGPWSDPVPLPEIKGIDPSFFFDDDGRAYIVNNGPPPDDKERYPGHRAIWLQEFDLAKKKLTGPRRIIVDGGSTAMEKPFWIEGPHLFKRAGHYYLIAAEGGTYENHSEVVFRSDSVFGPYVSFAENPILTQRTLPPDRKNAVTCAGHADFVETPSGEWWSVFLGCRPYDSQGNFNTGRETFMLPVTWSDDGWPMITKPGEAIAPVHARPDLPAQPPPPVPTNGNFTVRDEFDAETLGLAWNFLRTPHGDPWFNLTQKTGTLTLQARPASFARPGNPSFIGRRQQHAHFVATTAVRLTSNSANGTAGLVAFHDEFHFLLIGIRHTGAGRATVYVEGRKKVPRSNESEILGSADLASDANTTVFLKLEGKGATCDFSYATEPDHWIPLAQNIAADRLSAKATQAFVGTYLGMFATTGRN